jgi:hypothetical protein
MTDLNLDKCHGQYAVIDLTTGKAINSYDRFSSAQTVAMRRTPSAVIDLYTKRICDVFTSTLHLNVGIMGIRYTNKLEAPDAD